MALDFHEKGRELSVQLSHHRPSHLPSPSLILSLTYDSLSLILSHTHSVNISQHVVNLVTSYADDLNSFDSTPQHDYPYQRYFDCLL